MRLSEIENRLKEIKAELEKEDADIDALNKETNDLLTERKKILEDIETRDTILKNIANEEIGVEVRSFKEEVAPSVDKDLVKRAFLKNLLGEELTKEERVAFVHTTENTEAVVPTELQNQIYSYMEEKHPLLADVNVLRTGVVMSFVKHTAIVQGDAKEVGEAEANDDEQNTFVNVTLSGKDFSKHVDFSYRLGKMAIPAFETYLVKEIGDRLAAAMTRDIVAQIKEDVAEENQITAATAGEITLEDFLKALSKLKQTGSVNIYMNNASLYGGVALMEGAEGRLSFIPNYKEQISGQILGKPMKEEDALADGEIIILDPNQFVYNVVQDIMIERDKDIKKHVHTISGFAIAEGTMLNDKAGAVLTATLAGA